MKATARTKASEAGGKGEGTREVQRYLRELEHPHAAAVAQLRKLILAADSRIQEDIKWNAPSFCLQEHFATFRLAPRATFQLVFHTGAKARPKSAPFEMPDPEKRLRWAAPDRCVLDYASAPKHMVDKHYIRALVESWIRQL